MRLEIRDVQLHSPSPALAEVISKNKEIASKNRTLEYLAIGGVIVGVIFFLIYMESKKEKEEDEEA